MKEPTPPQYEISVADVEYLRHGDKALLARVYQPLGAGPFPLVIDLHGGGWCKKKRTSDFAANEAMAKSGIVVAALDFRMPPEAGYPASLLDINYAIRWFKLHAEQWKASPDRFGILGFSSGGHQAMLTAMRPNDARYSAVHLSGGKHIDAKVRCAILCWPVIDPLGRYHYAKREIARGQIKIMPGHDEFLPYWPSEAAMAEGNPTLALERGETIQMPPVLYIQGSADDGHPRENLDRFVAHYRKVGGRVDLRLIDGMRQSFITENPNAPASIAAIRTIIEFCHGELR